MNFVDPNDAYRHLLNKAQLASQKNRRTLIESIFLKNGDNYADKICDYLQQEGYDVSWRHDGYAIAFQFEF